MKNIIELIKSFYADLSPKERVVADYFLNNPAENLSIQSLAKKIHVSTATISRFTRTLGFKSFQDFKLASANQSPDPKLIYKNDEIGEGDSLTQILSNVFNASINSLANTAPLISEHELENAVSKIINARQLGLFGLGASNIVALDGYHKFLRTKVMPVHATDFHAQLMLSTRLTSSDCAIVVSHSGRDRDALQLGVTLKRQNVPLIVITSFGNSPLAKIADCVFLSISSETKYRSEALHALIAQISIIDSLYMMVAAKTPNESVKVYQHIRHEIDQTRPVN